VYKLLFVVFVRRYVRIYQQLKRQNHTLSYFSSRDWSFENENIVQLRQKLKNHGVNDLEFDGQTIDWTNEYAESYIPGLKKYYYKESMENLTDLRRQYKK
jgi:Male sterility protein